MLCKYTYIILCDKCLLYALWNCCWKCTYIYSFSMRNLTFFHMQYLLICNVSYKIWFTKKLCLPPFVCFKWSYQLVVHIHNDKGYLFYTNQIKIVGAQKGAWSWMCCWILYLIQCNYDLWILKRNCIAFLLQRENSNAFF